MAKSLPFCCLTSSDVCQLLRISRRTFYRWLAQGKLPLPDWRVGRSYRWFGDRKEFLNRMTAKRTPPAIAAADQAAELLAIDAAIQLVQQQAIDAIGQRAELLHIDADS